MRRIDSIPSLLRLGLLSLALGAPALRGEPEPAPAPSPEPKAGLTRAEHDILKAAGKTRTYHPFSGKELGLETPRASAMRMVRITLDFNPQVRLQETTVEGNEGAVQSESGEFDTHVTGRIGAQYDGSERRTRYRTHPVLIPAPTPYPNPLRGRKGVLDYELGLRKRLANGVVLNPHVGFTQSYDRDYGGSFSDDYRGSIGFSVYIPLGKGGGTVANQAARLAAKYDLLASVLQLRHITSQSVANTLQAYWACKAAEEIYRLRQEAEAIALRLLKVATSLVEGDELAPAQLLQIIADHEGTMANRIQAGRELIVARQTLATAAGVPPSSLLLAPLTSDPFPSPQTVESYPDEQALIAVALRHRDDLRAAQQTVKSKKVLVDAAYLDLRPTVDLKLSGGYFPFESRNQLTLSQGGNWQAGVELQLDWPIENNTALGAYTQSEALLRSSRITLEETERVMVSSVITALAELKAAAVNVKLFGESARWYEKALDAQEELFTLGHGSMTDTITARQRFVDARLQQVNARRNYAGALVRLRFATGVLLFSDEKGSWIDPEVWNRVPFAGKGK